MTIVQLDCCDTLIHDWQNVKLHPAHSMKEFYGLQKLCDDFLLQVLKNHQESTSVLIIKNELEDICHGLRS